jgi:hypothetical protein
MKPTAAKSVMMSCMGKTSRQDLAWVMVIPRIAGFLACSKQYA